MGANAQTSVPVFTAGQVLTAQQQTEINTGIPVFATTTTRDSAFGGTGEKTLAEGQMAYIENIAGSSAVQYYDGSAWQTLVQSGLTLIKSQTIGSGVASVTLSDVFSSTYDAYKITLTGGAGSTAGDMQMTLGATATGYYGALFYGNFNATSPLATSAGNNSASWNFVASATTDSLFANIELFAPFLAKHTRINSWSYNAAGAGGWMVGNLQNTTSYTAFTLAFGGNTMTGGTVRVYGYANS
jgi:hypothetical protein